MQAPISLSISWTLTSEAEVSSICPASDLCWKVNKSRTWCSHCTLGYTDCWSAVSRYLERFLVVAPINWPDGKKA